KGARSVTLAVLLAMLEDSGDEKLGMTKEKFNFFNMTKILQNSSKDYLELRNYFAGRSILSKAYSLSKQVCDAAEQTRASYMSIVYEKLTMFNDAGICALTSASDFSSEQLAQKPTALFLKIPDEKDTRHNLAAIFILNIYKTLIKVASATEELTLPRNVYFIMDEFGNMPKIEKFDKFITVGRSRKIWFTMIVQSYAQLNNVYGETVADIVKGNCGIKMFIGSNDMNTCKEYSELCGNITVVTSSTSGSVNGTDVNLSSQTQVRPLIYPSELQRLNHPGDIGHSIIVTFGNYPLKTYFSPSFKVPFYKTGKMDTSELSERYFDENAVVYKVGERNRLVLGGEDTMPPEKSAAGGTGKAEEEKRGEAAQTPGKDKGNAQPPAKKDGAEAELERLSKLWLAYKSKHPEATPERFFNPTAGEEEES
ncbi:MAG: type IV secretory system conjugative DNA transfer family protein, partial [Candidatus Scatosoma sp.]